MASIPVIKRRIITEKSSMLEADGKYVFLVPRSATKNEIKKAIKAMYKAEVRDVATICQKPKKTRYRGRVSMKQMDKKAIVTLKAGQKIEF